MSGAVRIGKRAFYDQIELPIDAAYALTGDVMVENMKRAGLAGKALITNDKSPKTCLLGTKVVALRWCRCLRTM